ncbi:hypothetical protein [Streptomyces acidiscabies]|uniref:Uncharacterized protein n=1 Tax=Streptomyces acidiscabies TaxID=42234 RepID=A0A0L0KP30_9ACTN|nr:hypothetical protein [Streptomyces acidiscabies]KND39601.1 hypothetical protein IQ63_02170 [Streptomyces acidiscabies]
MSQDLLSVIPANPRWQPDEKAAKRIHALVTSWFPEGSATYVEMTWYDTVTAISSGQNLDRIGCPACGEEIDLEEAHSDTGFTSLDFDDPCGFARFRVAVWDAERWFDDGELGALADALGHPVRQIRAYV